MWNVWRCNHLIINKFCRLADKTPFITFLYFIVEYTHLAISYKLLQLCKQLHSAKVFNNQQLNLLHFTLNTYHFYTFFTFIIHKIHSLRVECVNFVKFWAKIINQKKFFRVAPPLFGTRSAFTPVPLRWQKHRYTSTSYNTKSTVIIPILPKK